MDIIFDGRSAIDDRPGLRATRAALPTRVTERRRRNFLDYLLNCDGFLAKLSSFLLASAKAAAVLA